MSDGTLPSRCPSCGERMTVVGLQCRSCGTEVNGDFDICPVCALSESGRKMVNLFLDSRGNLKEVQRQLGLSYPTVRLKMEAAFRELLGRGTAPDPSEILEKLRNGEIDVETARRLLSGEP
jgi:hypothetical protein